MLLTTHGIKNHEINLFWLFKWILLTSHWIKSQEINSFRMDFMDVQVLNKFDDVLLR